MTGARTASVCSCSDCDSASCISARSKAGNGCSCRNCRHSNTCLFFDNRSLSQKRNKIDAYSQKNLETNRAMDKRKLPLQNICPKTASCCKKLVEELEIAYKTESFHKNCKEECKLSSHVPLKITCDNLHEISKFDSQPIVNIGGHVDNIIKADSGEQALDLCVKDNVALFTMIFGDSKCPSPCVFDDKEPFKLISESKSKTTPMCDTINETKVSDKMYHTVNDQSVSASKSDTTKMTDQIRIKLDAYDANKVYRVRSKFGTSKFVRGNTEVTKEQVQKEIVYESESDTNMDNIDSRYTEQDDNNHVQPPIKSVRSTAVSFSRSATNKTSAAQLSAQIMNVPFMEYQNSFDSANNVTKSTKISKYDILQRIKDVYKACTCKVCECIASVGLLPTTGKEDCGCKPCDCDECRKYRSPYHRPDGRRFLNKDLIECCLDTTNRFLPKSDVTRMTSELCGCKPCECSICRKFNISQALTCDCKPCECIECLKTRTKKTRTLIVAPVSQDSQHHQYCQCSPCRCAECGFNYGYLAPNLTQDTGTSAYYRHTNCNCESCINEACAQIGDSCHCERRNKLMRKPVRSDKNDYDIHNVIVSKSNNIGKNCKNTTCNNHTVTMFASFSSAKEDPNCYGFYTNHEKENDNVNYFKNLNISNKINYDYGKGNNCDTNVDWNKNKYNLLRSNKPCCKNFCINNTKLDLDSCGYEESKSCSPYKENTLNKIKTSKDTHVKQEPLYSSKVNKNTPSSIFAAKPWYLCKKSSTIECCEQNYKVFCMIPQQLDTSMLHGQEKLTVLNTNKFKRTGYNVSTTCTDSTNCKETDSDTSGSYTSARSSLHPETFSSRKYSSFSQQMKRLPDKSSDDYNSSGNDESDCLIKFPRNAVQTCMNDVLNLGTHINMKNINNSLEEEYFAQKVPEKLHKLDSNSRAIKPGQIYNATHYLKVPSVLSCNQCKCSSLGGLCTELCLSGKPSQYLRKCEKTQTLQKPKDYDVSTVRLDNRVAGFDTLTEESVPRPCRFTLADEPNEKEEVFTNKLQNCCNLELATSAKPNNVLYNNLSNKNEILFTPLNYDGVENTIQEAREFSLKLLTLLHKYEKANREFESVSEKLRMSQNEVVHSNVCACRFEEPEKDQMVLNKEGQSIASIDHHVLHDDAPTKIDKEFKDVSRTNFINPNYTANIQNDDEPIDVIVSKGDSIMNCDTEIGTESRELLLPSSYNATTKCDLDTNSKVELIIPHSYKAYKKLIKKAAAKTKRSNTKNNLVNLTSSGLELKASNTTSRTKSMKEKVTLNQNERDNDVFSKKLSLKILYQGSGEENHVESSEIKFADMPDDKNIRLKKGNTNFKENLETQV